MGKFLFVCATVFSLSVPNVARAANCGLPNSIISVRNYASHGFEYVRFKYRKPPALPTFAVTAATGPFTEDPSGNPVTITGPLYTQVQFRGVEWTCTIVKQLSLPRRAVKAVKSIGQFEGVITYIIGRSAASHFISTSSYNLGSFRMIRVKFKP